MRRAAAIRAALAMLAILTMPDAARAQIRASEIGTVSLVVDGTRIAVQYSRPRARGRYPLFGTRAAEWGEVWTPGANWATTLDVGRNVKVNGRALAKGTYSVWMVVARSGDWTVVLDPRARLYHMAHPDSTAAQIRFPAKADSVAFTEVLTWSVPDVRVNGATLAMQWGTTRVRFDVEVEPSLSVTMAAGDAAPYVGRYAYEERGANGAPPKQMGFVVSYEDGTLKGQFEPNDPYMQRFALIRVAPDIFVPGLYDEQGRIYEVLRPEMVFTFSRVAGRPTTFEIRGEDDALEGTGRRRP
jgi:hypothetical protein